VLRVHATARIAAGHATLVDGEAACEEIAMKPEDEARLAELERQGLIRRGKGDPLSVLRGPLPKSQKSVVEALIEERREGR
jgi:hypothetical protein